MERARGSSSRRESRDNESQSKPKRKRIALACTACRARKAKCDGKQPRCSSCEAMEYACTYMQSEASPNMIIGREYLAALEARLASVEQRLNVAVHEGGPSSRGPGPIVLKTTSEAITEEEEDTGGGPHVTVDDFTVYFGPTSSAAFTREISRLTRLMVQPGPETAFDALMAIDLRSPSGSPVTEPAMLASNDALPPPQITRPLIKQYFEGPWMLCPMLHRDTFLETYEEGLRHDFRYTRSSWLAVLHAVLALTGLASPSVNSRPWNNEESDICYRRAKSICKQSRGRKYDIEIVQCYTLLTQYSHILQRFDDTWETHFSTINIAFHLGLHVPHIPESCTGIERELRRRTWVAYQAFNESLCTAFGRPSLISSRSLDSILPEYFSQSPIQTLADDEFDTITTDYFRARIKLCRITNAVTEQLYGGNIQSLESNELSAVITHYIDLTKALDLWKAQLSPTLSMLGLQDQSVAQINERTTNLIRCFRVALLLRYQYTRMLLNRPFCLEYLHQRNSRPESSTRSMATHIGRLALGYGIRSATETIDILNNLNIEGEMKSILVVESAFFPDYVYDAGLIILANLIANHINLSTFFQSTNVQVYRIFIDRAIAILHDLDHSGKTASARADFLWQVCNTITNLNSEMHGPQGSGVVPPQNLEAGGWDVNMEMPFEFDLQDIITHIDIEGLINHPEM